MFSCIGGCYRKWFSKNGKTEKTFKTKVTSCCDGLRSCVRCLMKKKNRVHPEKESETASLSPGLDYSSIELDHLEYCTTLGRGAFGRVELVLLKTDRSRSFALKCMAKKGIVDKQAERFVYSEKKIMMEANSAFIARMYGTFKDTKYVYMLLEACLGGNIRRLLKSRLYLNNSQARFYTACVVVAFEYLHDRGVVYRDLKPDNLLLDSRGYLKLVDCGIAKEIGVGNDTHSICGTPQYIAPEVVLNSGHDFSVDIWALGVLVFELLSGRLPFNGLNAKETIGEVLKGIDKIQFPVKIKSDAESLIKSLCRQSQSERLGIVKIKEHKWFKRFDWEALASQRMKPPIDPKVNSPTDTKNFDPCRKNKKVPPDETSGWDADF